MIFLDLNKENVGTAYELFEDAVRAKEVLFCPFESQSDFFEFFMEDQAEEVHKITILEEHGWGFASGCFLSGESRAYLFFKNCRYRDYAMQNSYYLDLDDYSEPDFAADIKERLEKDDITIEIYNSDRHYGMEEMIHKFQNPLWERDILGEAEKGENSRPILIAAHNGKVIGFTGPLDVE